MKYSISESMLREMIGEAVKKAKRSTYPNAVSHIMGKRDELPVTSPYHPDNRFYQDEKKKENNFEGKIRKIVRESVRRSLSEAGHLYWKDEEGVAHSNSKDLYRGVPGAILVSHGEWADPEILYKGKEIDYYDIEDGLWASYNDFMKYASEEEKAEFSNDMGVEAVPDNDEVYEKYIEWRGGVEYVQEELDNLVWSMDGCQ